MSWVKLDDHFDEHPKFARVGPLGLALWVTGLAYCNRNLTDGFIPWAVARNLLSWEFVGPADADGRKPLYTVAMTSGMGGEDVSCKAIIPLLLDAELWDEVEGGYLVHDYNDYQPSKAQIESERKANAERQSRYRDRQSGRYSDKSNGVTDGVSSSVSNDRPVPDPVPVSHIPPTPQGESTSTLEQRFDRFWSAYPKKVSKGQARKAWVRLKPDDLLTERMVRAVRAQAASPDWQKEDGRYIPYPATWLNAEKWMDGDALPDRPLTQDELRAKQLTEFKYGVYPVGEAGYRQWLADRKAGTLPQLDGTRG